MARHVLVLSLSTFNNQNKLELNKYAYVDPLSKQQSFITYGFYQLAPVVNFIKYYLKQEITDVLLLETKSTKKSQDITFNSSYEECNQTNTPELFLAYARKISPHQYFVFLLQCLFKDLKEDHIKVIDIDPQSNDQKFIGTSQKIYDEIKRIYLENDQASDVSSNDWRLWIDTHGGLRNYNLSIISAIRALAVNPDHNIMANGIFTIYFNRGNLSYIKDQTALYYVHSSEKLRDFLNYGQYIFQYYTPYIGNDPFAFISYRHDPSYLKDVRKTFDLLGHYKIRYWFDQDISAGEYWDQKLKAKNEASTLLIILLTNSYFTSSECWKELIRAIHYKKEAYYKSNHHESLADYLQKHIKIIALEDDLYVPQAIGDFDQHSLPKDFDQNAYQARIAHILEDTNKTTKSKDTQIVKEDIPLIFNEDNYIKLHNKNVESSIEKLYELL